MKRFQALVFDWDGTLFDSTALIVDAIQGAFAEIGRPVPGRLACRSIIGLGLQEAMQRLDADLPAGEQPALIEAYRRRYLAGDEAVTLFDDVRESLARYREQGYFLAVATGKSRRGLERALDVSGLRPFFDITRCADETFSKPHPEMLLQIMDFLGLNAESVLMVGDTSHDMELARNANTSAAAVTYGAHSREVLASYAPLALCDSFKAFDTWLNDIV